MSKIEELMAQKARQEEIARKNMAAQERNAKRPFVQAFQRQEITAEEYEEALGEPFAQTMKDFYAADLENIREQMISRVKCGSLTPEQYKEITGVDYPGEVETA